MNKTAAKIVILDDIQTNENGGFWRNVLVLDDNDEIITIIEVPTNCDDYNRFSVITGIRVGISTWHIDENGDKRQIA